MVHVGSLESATELLETNSQNKHFSALLGSLTTVILIQGTREISGRDYRDFFITTLKKNGNNNNNNNNHLERLASHYQCLFGETEKIGLPRIFNSSLFLAIVFC